MSEALHDAASQPLLIEIFVEELPPKALARLSEAFAAAIVGELIEYRLIAENASFTAYASPRRLALRVEGVATRAPDQTASVRGPSIAVALDGVGQPTMALRKWADKQGARIDQLVRRSDGKQQCFWFDSTVPGHALEAIVGEVIDRALERLPIPKMMQYQLADGRTSVSFVRPAHGLVVLHGASVLPAKVLGLDAGRTTHGHRFQGRADIELAHADEYERRLADEGRVLASMGARRERIATMLRAAAAATGASLGEDDAFEALLDEVTALVEWPAVYVGEFDPAFLAVPQECLILTMRTNQKYFPLFDDERRLRPQFLIVSNMAIDDPSDIIDGNQRVVRPRLADAQFFFDQDKRTKLADRVTQLSSIVYHAKLGTLGERVDRIRGIASSVAAARGKDVERAERAALLAKADLVSAMVGEFPELQGVMGRYYAEHDGEEPEVATAIAEHYLPRFAGDALPATDAGLAVALADKLETLAGIWGIGQQPTGDRDPFALRRHALGVVRMLIERELALPLRSLLQRAFSAFENVPAVSPDVDGLAGFVVDRLRGYLRDQGFAATDIDAVLATDANRLDQVRVRLEAIGRFRELPESESLAAANKRIANILRKSEASVGRLDSALLAQPEEQALHEAIATAAPIAEQRLAQADYAGALVALAVLREPVDAFFDKVMVNTDDPRVRENRLALLAGLHRLMNRVADLSKLAA